MSQNKNLSHRGRSTGTMPPPRNFGTPIISPKLLDLEVGRLPVRRRRDNRVPLGTRVFCYFPGGLPSLPFLPSPPSKVVPLLVFNKDYKLKTALITTSRQKFNQPNNIRGGKQHCKTVSKSCGGPHIVSILMIDTTCSTCVTRCSVKTLILFLMPQSLNVAMIASAMAFPVPAANLNTQSNCSMPDPGTIIGSRSTFSSQVRSSISFPSQ